MLPAAPDPAQVAGAVDRYLALREFRARLYGCLTARADACFELCDAILCADHAVTSLVQLSLVPEFRRGHGALYDALAAGQVDEEAFAALLTGTLPALVDGDEGRWPGSAEHDRIDYGLLEQALAGVPAAQAAQVREACARWGLSGPPRSTPPPIPARMLNAPPAAATSTMTPAAATAPARPSPAGNTSSPRRWGTCAPPGPRWSMPSAPRPAARTQQTARQVRNLLRRLHAAGTDDCGAPLVIMDAGYSAAALTAALAGQPVHLLIRLAAGSVLYANPVTWPGKTGRPGKHGMPVTCHNDPDRANPEPDESLTLPDTPLYGTVQVSAWREVHPLIHGDRGWFADNWEGELPVLHGTVLRVIVEHLPDGRKPHKTMWLWHAGPAPLSLDELWRAYLARFDEEHAFKFAKGTLGLTAARVRTPEQADRWVRLVMAAQAQLLLARPLAEDLRRPWETRPPDGRPLTPGRVRRGFANIRRLIWAPPPMSLNPPGPAPDGPKGSAAGPAPRYPVPKKTGNTDKTDTPAAA